MEADREKLRQLNKKVMTIDIGFKRILLSDELRHGIPWDGMGRFVNPMGWEGTTCKSHGLFFSSHPIPLGALMGTPII
jgi:hypothetical protein